MRQSFNRAIEVKRLNARRSSISIGGLEAYLAIKLPIITLLISDLFKAGDTGLINTIGHQDLVSGHCCVNGLLDG